MDGMLQYFIPLVFMGYAALLGFRKPAYKSDKGFATKRAMENEQIWNYVQKAASITCLVMGVVLFASAYAFERLIEGNAAYYAQIAVEVVGIALLIPIVNFITNKKFPKK